MSNAALAAKKKEIPKLTISSSLPSLAYTEMRIIMARFIYNFEWTLVEDPVTQKWPDSQNIWLLWDKPELKIRLKLRA